MSDIVIKVENLSKAYKLYDNPTDRLKESLHPLRKKYHKDFYALKDVSFEIKKGETVGIIGKNGSGKSTLLKIITGVLTPTSGNVQKDVINVFFHISLTKLTENQLNFIPRIPPENNRLKTENITISRICVSKTILGCMNAITSQIHDILLEQHKKCKKIPMYLYGISENKIPEDKIITANKLMRNNYVEDACITKEHWILIPIKMRFLGTIYLRDEMEKHIRVMSCNECEKFSEKSYEFSKCEECPYPYVDSWGYLSWKIYVLRTSKEQGC